MPPRDYKNTARKTTAKTRPPGSWASFVSGLGIGLVVALGVYVWRGELLPQGGGVHENPVTDLEEAPPYSSANFEELTNSTVPKPKFDFYKILPEIEVKVPDWEISSPAANEKKAFKQGTYVLQVGSFKQYGDADRAKAELALTGIQAKIHRVVINGQDVWYRVHVGPYSDIGSIRTMRAKLIGSGKDFILLKIGDGAG